MKERKRERETRGERVNNTELEITVLMIIHYKGREELWEL